MTGIPLLIHSAPLWLLAELGLVGFVVFALPGAYAFVTEWCRAQRDQAAAFGVLLMLAFALMCAPADMFYQRTFWLLIGATLAVPLGTLTNRERGGIFGSMPRPLARLGSGLIKSTMRARRRGRRRPGSCAPVCRIVWRCA
jgi:4-amino-4-deoxy-L-arabinose transferase-like glycosyltransferase